MRKKIIYIILFIILFLEFIAYRYQYYFINSYYFLIINLIIFLIFLKLINNKIFTKIGFTLILLTLLCSIAMNNPTYNYTIENVNLTSPIIIEEVSSFNGKFQYSFFQKHFYFFKKPIPKAYFVSSYKLNLDKDIDINYLDKNTIQVKSNTDLFDTITLNLK